MHFCLFVSLAQRKNQRDIHPTKASPQGEDATAPPVARNTKVSGPSKVSLGFLWLREPCLFYWLREQRGAGAEQGLIPENTRGAPRG